jgi:WD40 repeat protein
LKPIRLGGHDDGVYGVSFSPDGKYLVTGSYDKKVILWDVSFLKDTTKKLDYTVIEDHTESVRTVAFAPNGKYFLTAGYDNRLLKYGLDGKLIKEVIKITDETFADQHGFGDIHSISISDDSKTVVIGTNLTSRENVWVVDVETGKKINSFKLHDNTVMSVDFYGNDLIASAGGELRDIYVWEAKSGKVKAHFKGNGKRVYSVGINDKNQIAFGNTGVELSKKSINYFGDLEKYFDIDNMNVYDLGEEEFKTENITYDGKYLQNSGLSQLYLMDAESEPIAMAELDPNADGLIRCFTFTENGEVVVGTNYKIIIYDINMNRLRTLNGHTSDVYSLASNKRTLVSGSADQTIRVWDLDDQGKYYRTKEQFKQYLLDLGVTQEKLDDFLKDKNITFDQLYESENIKTVTPKATIYTSDLDWIIYTDKNYYAASKNGSRNVGFHLNQGMDKAAKFHSFRQFDIQLNRPEKIMETFASTNAQLKEAFILARKKRIERSGFTVKENTEVDEAPELELNNLQEIVKVEKYKLKFLLKGANLKTLFVYVNGVPVEILGGADLSKLADEGSYQVIMYSCDFKLIPGRNHVEIWATNTSGISSSVESVVVQYLPESIPKPDLYIVSIGVSEYNDNSKNLNYAAKDANDIVNLFSTNKQYGEVNKLVLTNDQFTSKSKEEIKTFLNKANLTDHVIVFYAGHGVFDKKYTYYISTHNMDFSKPEAKGISYSEFEDLFATSPSRNKLVLLDACHSGEIDKEEVEEKELAMMETKNVKFRNVGNSTVAYKSGLGISSFTLMKNMFTEMNDKTGATIIGSAGGLEFAMEGGEWKNGLFTYSLIDGLKNKKADSDANGEINVTEIGNYVKQNVSELSAGKQVPTSRNENIETNFKVW